MADFVRIFSIYVEKNGKKRYATLGDVDITVPHVTRFYCNKSKIFYEVTVEKDRTIIQKKLNKNQKLVYYTKPAIIFE